MAKLDVKEQKTLKLVNVLIKTITDVSVEVLDSEIAKFVNFIEVSRIKTRGPLITCNRGTSINSLGKVTTDYTLMVQTNCEYNLKDFVFKKDLKITNCLYVRYIGNPDDFGYAQIKLDLHIWENNLIDKGEIYIVHVNTDKTSICADIFCPVESFHENIQ